MTAVKPITVIMNTLIICSLKLSHCEAAMLAYEARTYVRKYDSFCCENCPARLNARIVTKPFIVS